ncbi:MAG: hypothetical protein IKI69_02095 [Oscillospiraceae bacterium]|nr:hypothetical protein [Oscillospiraceae bacterium]
MDIERARADLAERFPQWAERIRMLNFVDAVGIGPADNDGRTIYYNDRILSYYTRETQCFYMAQQLLHIQLAHHARGAGRDRRLWKRASDAVVNAMLRADGFVLPGDLPIQPEAEGQSAEALYALWLADVDEDGQAEAEEELVSEPQPDKSQKAGGESAAHEREMEDPGIAAAVAGLYEMLEPTLQVDFDWFPGSSIRKGVLGYEFCPYPVARAEILLDTSASVDEALLRSFVRGVKALMREDAVVRVGCFDTRFYGFQDIHGEEDVQALSLEGSGGTDFHAAIEAFTGDAENQIIFTDGYAEMPEQFCDAVWVVYGGTTIHPKGGRVIYVKPSEEKEKHEIDFLIT